VACDDGDACTTGETCQAGACKGGSIGGYVAYFEDSFADASKGWTLGAEWEIGPAMASNGCQVTGYDDPVVDHTATSDNGIAGVVIGGCANDSQLHPMRYLTSPSFDATEDPGSVILSYWRLLNTDYTPYMESVVEVYDGSVWIEIWSSGDEAVEDAAWTHVSHDVTAYKNAQMRVRFGFEVGDLGVFSVTGWNLDDVAVTNIICDG
jgi:hypothetical protein